MATATTSTSADAGNDFDELTDRDPAKWTPTDFSNDKRGNCHFSPNSGRATVTLGILVLKIGVHTKAQNGEQGSSQVSPTAATKRSPGGAHQFIA